MKNIVEKLQEKRNLEVAKSILESNGYKVTKKSKRLKDSRDPRMMTYDYDEEDILICDSPDCDHESVVYVPYNDREAVDYLRSNGTDGLYVSVPGDDIMNAEDYLEYIEINESKGRKLRRLKESNGNSLRDIARKLKAAGAGTAEDWIDLQLNDWGMEEEEVAESGVYDTVEALGGDASRIYLVDSEEIEENPELGELFAQLESIAGDSSEVESFGPDRGPNIISPEFFTVMSYNGAKFASYSSYGIRIYLVKL